jgi:hypothetical protein
VITSTRYTIPHDYLYIPASVTDPEMAVVGASVGVFVVIGIILTVLGCSDVDSGQEVTVESDRDRSASCWIQ